MLVKYILNNYQVGAMLRTAPQDYIISKERIDKSHTEVIFDFGINERKKEFCDKLFAQKGIIL